MLQNALGGKILNIASLLSFRRNSRSRLCRGEGRVAQLTKALANEWASQGINVNAIAPGYMATDNTTALRNDPVRSRQILDRIPAAGGGSQAISRGPRYSCAHPQATMYTDMSLPWTEAG